MNNSTQITNLPSSARISAIAFFLVFLMALSPSSTAQQSLNDYSVLPENLNGDVTTNPNVLIIIDNSTSMSDFSVGSITGGEYQLDPKTGVRYLERNSYSDPSSSFSNSYQVRDAILKVLGNPAYTDNINVGIMAFGQSPCTYHESDNDDYEDKYGLEFTCPDDRVATTGLGVLKANIKPLAGAHKTLLEKLLAFEPSPYDDNNDGLDRNIGYDSSEDDRFKILLPPTLVNGAAHPIASVPRGINGTEETIITMPGSRPWNWTPLGGAMETAFRYLFHNDPIAQQSSSPVLGTDFLASLASRENGLALTAGGAAGTIEYPTPGQCEGPLTVILLTDGEPTQLPPASLISGNGSTSSPASTATIDSAKDAAERIRFRGYLNNTTGLNAVPIDDRVDVHVIAFNLLNSTAADAIAVEGGTGAAVLAGNTADVEAAFSDIFDDILTKGATRSGISIIATPDSAVGSFVQPSFTPLLKSVNETEKAAWTGELKSFFIDKFGNFRDNSGSDLTALDDLDKGFRILFDKTNEQTYVETFNVDSTTGAEGTISGRPDGNGGYTNGLIEVNDLAEIWSAHDQLGRLDDNVASIAQNRAFSTAPGATGPARHIFTWVNTNGSNGYTAAEKVDFEWSATGSGKITPATKGFFDLPAANNSNADAEKLINYIRGMEFANLRNRTLDNEKYILGDIVHSTPVQVDGPLSLSFGNHPLSSSELRDTYAPFATHYSNRRKMIYVGANDGMLHAFNGGFWTVNAGAIAIARQRSGAGFSDTNFELGDEVWAYVPYAVLPQLKFLASNAYESNKHISFVDGTLRSYEVKIFGSAIGNCANKVDGDDTSGCKYVNGWGTILVGGMRLGGADYTADFDGNGSIDADETTRSSFFIFDVTDPESAPVLMDEITHQDLELTTGKPALVRLPGASSTEREYRMVFGSGPTDIATVTNDTTAKSRLFVYDFETPGTLSPVTVSESATGSFIGDISVADWDQDDADDAIYFGTVAGDQAAPTGRLIRGQITISTGITTLATSLFMDVGQPVQHEPVIPTNQALEENKYILFGTGRVFATGDFDKTYSPKNYLYGVQEAFSSPGVIKTTPAPVTTVLSLLNTTGQDITAKGDDDAVLGTEKRAEILAHFEADPTDADYLPGWRFELPENTSRLSARPVTLEEIAFFTDFQAQDPGIPTPGQCLPTGGGFLSVLDYRTGIFPSNDRLDLDPSLNTGDSLDDFLNAPVSNSILAAGQILYIGTDDDGNTKFKFAAPGSNQEITEFGGTLIGTTTPLYESGRKSWREISL